MFPKQNKLLFTFYPMFELVKFTLKIVSIFTFNHIYLLIILYKKKEKSLMLKTLFLTDKTKKHS